MHSCYIFNIRHNRYDIIYHGLSIYLLVYWIVVIHCRFILDSQKQQNSIGSVMTDLLHSHIWFASIHTSHSHVIMYKCIYNICTHSWVLDPENLYIMWCIMLVSLHRISTPSHILHLKFALSWYLRSNCVSCLFDPLSARSHRCFNRTPRGVQHSWRWKAHPRGAGCSRL